MAELWDLAYCVNLARRGDRWSQAQHEFETIGLEVERWEAIDWKHLPKDYARQMTRKVPQDHNILGHVACGMSHHGALKDANDRGAFSVAIFEDDVLLASNIRTVFDYVHDQIFSGWQFLYLGYRPFKSEGAVQPCTNNLVWVNHCYDAHAYVVSQPLLEELVRTWDPKRLTTDWRFERIPDRLGTSPMVAHQNKMLSSEMDPNVGGLLV